MWKNVLYMVHMATTNFISDLDFWLTFLKLYIDLHIMPVRPARQGRAPVYDHFSDGAATGTAVGNALYECKHCGVSVSTNKNATSNLIRHLQVCINFLNIKEIWYQIRYHLFEQHKQMLNGTTKIHFDIAISHCWDYYPGTLSLV